MGRALRIAAVLMAGLGAACADGIVAFNDPCSGLVEESQEVVGRITGPIYLDEANARHANHPIAALAAEAFIDAHKDTGAPADIGFLNGGAIRPEGGAQLPNGQCRERLVLAPGASPENPAEITSGDIHAILLFQNVVYAVDLTPAELKAVMEHSVAALVPRGMGGENAPIFNPSGRFLSVAGATVRVDCSQPAGQSRVREIILDDGRVIVSGGVEVADAGMVRAAMPEFLLRGGDGYAMLDAARIDLSRNPLQTQKEGGIDNDITAAYMKANYLETPLEVFPGDAEACTDPERTAPACMDQPGRPCCRGNVKLLHCAAPLPPQ